MADRFKNLIDGKRVDAAAGGVFDDTNPANRSEILGAFPRSDYRDADRAVEVARAARGVWGEVPSPQRASRLLRAADALRAQQDALVELIVRETGKVQAEALAEVQDALEAMACFAGEGMQPDPGGRPFRDAGERLAFGLRVPVGVVAVIASWCHPLGGIVHQVLPALAAGCPVVLKPAEDAPLVAARFAELLLEAGVPSAALGVVHGTGEEAGASLVRHPDVALVSFSGSSDVGREVAIACAAVHKPVRLDLGGRSATLVLDDADMEAALEGTLSGAMATSGQRRAPATRVLVHKKALREFSERLAARVQALRVGEGMSPGVDLGPLINDGRLKRTHAFTRVALKEGAKLLCGGEVLREGEYRKGFFYAPTLLGDAAPTMRAARDPACGPTIVLLAIGGMDEGLEVAERIGIGIGLAVYTQRLDRACLAVDRASVRSVMVNAPIGSEGFGPTAPESRQGEGSGTALAAYAEWRSVVLRPGRGWRRIPGHPAGSAPPEASAGPAPGGAERPKA
jgi:acyl-CoA reductase-like NAD-dependent aldehyde dehydrogenase